MPESSNNTSHSAEAARACSHFTETKHFPACSLPLVSGAFKFCIPPLAICIWLIYKRTPNLANVDKKFQTKVEKFAFYHFLFLRCLYMFPAVPAYYNFPRSSRFTGFVSHRISKIKISKSASIPSSVTIFQELTNKQRKAYQSLWMLKYKEYLYLWKILILSGFKQNAWDQPVKTCHNNRN